MNKPTQTLFTLVLFLGGCLLPPLPAQDQALESPYEPSLGLAFPLRQDPDLVVVTQRVLLNDTTILEPGDVFRVLFERPNIADKDVRTKKRASEFKQTYQTRQQTPNMEQPNTDEQALYKAALDRAVKNFWHEEIKFRAMLHHLDMENTILVFQRPGQTKMMTELMILPADLLLSENSGHLVVLSVLKDSKSAQLGITAGSQLLALNGKELNKLEDFRDRYYKEQLDCQNAHQPLTLTLLPKGQTEPVTVSFKPIPSLNSNPLLLDFPEQPTKTN